MKHKTIVIFFPILCIIFFVSGFLASFFSESGKISSDNRLINLIVSACKDSGYKPSCYDKEIPRYTTRLSMEQSFDITRQVQAADKSYQYCHVLGHELSARETKKDLLKWKDVIARCPSGMCSNGCIHGAFQERFRTDAVPDDKIASMQAELDDVCKKRGNWTPTGMEQASCYHALGHLLMYITSARIEKALTMCDDLTIEFRNVCYDGAFMQIFQPLEPEDFALVKGKAPTKDSAKSFCSAFSGNKLASCWSESWPLFREFIQTPSGLTAHCGYLPSDLEDHCYRALLYVLTVQFGFSEDLLEQYCRKLPSPYDARCFAMTASRYIETDWKNIDRAIAWCDRVSESDTGDVCYRELIEQASFTVPFGSSEQKRICSGIPERLRSICGKKP